MIVKKMSQIILKTTNLEEVKTLFVEFVENAPNLKFVSWELARLLVSGVEYVKSHFESALELGALGGWYWYGKYELVRNSNGGGYKLTLIPYTDRKLIISHEQEDGYRMFTVVVDYTTHPTTHHQYSELGVREYVLEEEEEFNTHYPIP